MEHHPHHTAEHHSTEYHEHREHPHHGHGQQAADRGSGWSTAVRATLHCLTGCAAGEILGMVVGTALGLHNGATVVLSVALAFVLGYALTMYGVRRAGLPLGAALKVALAADTVSILVMELIDNTVMVTVPGAMDAGLGRPLFWASLLLSLVIAFALTVPVNHWLISRGRGHAAAHAHH
ncbi:DUF4396 domain-containing protein [Streptomyces sp. NRRL B-24484]|uniref:DUF4396 domain-containing protein n=1 Tax=Streptomyces sp. NRRL B-24484 TaxID=1463833 RepID=UPI0004C16027|nr:DUF4396 domain-containing protein [Streptomyces sp. NRRL B-24484]